MGREAWRKTASNSSRRLGTCKAFAMYSYSEARWFFMTTRNVTMEMGPIYWHLQEFDVFRIDEQEPHLLAQADMSWASFDCLCEHARHVTYTILAKRHRSSRSVKACHQFRRLQCKLSHESAKSDF